MNFGCWNALKMAEKHGNRWRPSWKTSTSPGTKPLFARLPTNGANFMMSQYLHLLHPLRHLFRYFHILNIPKYMFHNRSTPFLITCIFFNPAGGAPPNTTLKAIRFLYHGLRGDRHPLHQRHFLDLLRPPPNLRLRIIHLDTTQHKNQTLWICPTPVCDLLHASENKMIPDLVWPILACSPWTTIFCLCSYHSHSCSAYCSFGSSFRLCRHGLTSFPTSSISRYIYD